MVELHFEGTTAGLCLEQGKGSDATEVEEMNKRRVKEPVEKTEKGWPAPGSITTRWWSKRIELRMKTSNLRFGGGILTRYIVRRTAMQLS